MSVFDKFIIDVSQQRCIIQIPSVFEIGKDITKFIGFRNGINLVYIVRE